MQIKFTILGDPKSKQSFKIGLVNGRIIKYQSKEVKQNCINIQWQIIQQLPKEFKPIKSSIYIKKLHYIFSIPKSFSKKLIDKIEQGNIIHKTTKPDLTDNLSKGLFDAMQNIVFVNDSQICTMDNVKKYYGTLPRIEIEIEY